MRTILFVENPEVETPSPDVVEHLALAFDTAVLRMELEIGALRRRIEQDGRQNVGIIILNLSSDMGWLIAHEVFNVDESHRVKKKGRGDPTMAAVTDQKTILELVQCFNPRMRADAEALGRDVVFVVAGAVVGVYNVNNIAPNWRGMVAEN